jgi:hypothetical protein
MIFGDLVDAAVGLIFGGSGENHEKAKLNRAAVAAIKVAPRGYGRTKELANRYGVAVGTINAIWRGQTWKSVT